MTPNARFTQFLQDIEPSPTTTSQAISAHENMRDFLAKHPQLSKRHVKTFLSGSYKRNTSIRPRTEAGVTMRPDGVHFARAGAAQWWAPAHQRRLTHHAVRSAHRALDPVSRRVKANVKRLRQG